MNKSIVQRGKRVAVGVMLLALVSGCGSDTTPPTAPSLPPVEPTPAPAPPAPPSAGPGQGTIVIGGLTPAGGATLAVQSECPAGRVTRVCTDNWRGTFEVTLDREMTYAVLTVTFYDGETKCGYGANTMDVVPVDTRVSFTVERIFLSDEFGTFAPCRLPATANRIRVELWSDSSSWTNTLIQDFAMAYTFSER